MFESRSVFMSAALLYTILDSYINVPDKVGFKALCYILSILAATFEIKYHIHQNIPNSLLDRMTRNQFFSIPILIVFVCVCTCFNCKKCCVLSQPR